MRKRSGFTLIELLVVLSIVALLLSIIAPRYMNQTDKAKEAVLKENLYGMRKTIDQYYSDKGYYPESLQILVEDNYLRKVPVDTITNRNDTWIIIYKEGQESQVIYDIKSGAQGTAKDGTEYVSW